MKLLFLTILLYFNISTSWTQTQAPPSAIDHANDVTAQLASLRAVNITWSIPSENNAPILSYTLMFCARLETGCEDGTFTNVTLMVGSEQLVTVGGNRLRYSFPELFIGKQYEVVIRARNSIGQQTSPAFGNGLGFNSAFPDDGQVVNVASVPSTNTIILTWNLPPLALATNNLDVSFNVTYFSNNITNIMSVAVEYNAARLEQGISVDLMMADSLSRSFEITAWYNSLNLLSSQATLTGVQTLANDATLLGPEAVVSNDVSPDDVLTISWPPPMNTNFLVAYFISYTTRPVHSQRQMSSPVHVEVPEGMTRITLPFTPFTNFTVYVDAVYAPPPNGTRVVINLLPPTTFITPQRASSPPLNVMGVNESMIRIRLSWQPPTSPNGIVTGYRIVGSTSGQDNFARTIIGANTLTFLSSMLFPVTKYTFRVAALNGPTNESPIIGMYSPDTIVYTSFSVIQPVIASTAVGDPGNPLFMITTGYFSDELGGVGVFKIVVVRGSRVEPRDIPDNSLAPFGISPFVYYVAYYGDAHRLGRFISTTIIIGDNGVTTDGSGTRFTNPPPEIGEDYYVFIRLYSAIDASIFVDSELTDVLRVESMSGGAPQLVPVISLLLLIITSLVFNVE